MMNDHNIKLTKVKKMNFRFYLTSSTLVNILNSEEKEMTKKRDLRSLL